MQSKMIYIASDHAGFERKAMLSQYLASTGYELRDFGPAKLDPQDDYPDYAEPLARAVAKDAVPGIVLCGNAEGVCIVANKVKGVRAAVGYSVEAAKTSRTDDNTNVLCVPGREFTDDQAKAMVDAWLSTSFSGAERHVRRLKKVNDLDSNR